MRKRCCYLEVSCGFLQAILETTIDSAWLLMTFYNCHLLLLFVTTVINNYGVSQSVCFFKRAKDNHRIINTGNRNQVDRNFSDHNDLGNRPL